MREKYASMIEKFIKFYTSLPANEKHVFHVLALSPNAISLSELLKVVNLRITMTHECLKTILYFASEQFLVRDNYTESYLLKQQVLVWIYPLITGYNNEKEVFAENRFINKYYFYRYDNTNKYVLYYLDALFNQPEKLKTCEDELFRMNEVKALTLLFAQPLYENYYDRISTKIMDVIFPLKVNEEISKLHLLSEIRRIEARLNMVKTTINNQQALLYIKCGEWKLVNRLLSSINNPLLHFAKACLLTMNSEHDKALISFDKGLQKQRRDLRQSYIPVIPEVALCYFVSLTAVEQELYVPVLERINDQKTKIHSHTDSIFLWLSRYLTSNASEYYKEKFKYFETYENQEVCLWKIIGLGFMGVKSFNSADELNAGVELTRMAILNGYLPASYEAAYTLMKMGSNEAADMVRQLSEILPYKPVLSQVKFIDEWEKQINVYLSLDAVKKRIKQDGEVGKARVAYRFFPLSRTNPYALPILQTRQANGAWTSGRNIALSNFVEGKADGMSDHDKRIAAALTYRSYEIDEKAIAEMVGHPYIFLEDSDIQVELIAARPALSVHETQYGDYQLQSDLTTFRKDITIEKETNTRYKVYRIDKQQREILHAVREGKTIPEVGKEKLIKVLGYFSAYLEVHADLIIDDDHVQSQQMEADSRIRVQLLPLSEGLKAELFVKPFGDRPPYCKPGKGCKTLMNHQNGDRLLVTRDIPCERDYADRILSDLQMLEGYDAGEGVMLFNTPYESLELLDILKRHINIAVVEWPEGERLKVRYAANFDNLNLRLTSGMDWFEMEGELQLDEQTVISVGRLLELVKNSHGRFVELAEGEYIALSEKLKRRLTELSAFSTTSKNGVIINRFASASILDSFDDFATLTADKAWYDFRERLKAAQDIDMSVPVSLQAELRPYQEEGYRWMTRLSSWGAGACLADDMGLGKTVQAIAVMLQRASLGPALVVSPLSVRPNWISETNRFAPSLTVKTLNDGIRAEILASLGAGDLLVTTYGLLQTEEEALTAVQWATVTLDEAHAIKNYNTKTSKAAMSLTAGFKMALTGTPIQNYLGEMWNIFQFINPGLLGTLTHFTDNFIRSADKQTRQRLKKLITPFILRRTKTAVLDELPPKTEIIRKIELSTEEMAFYEALRRHAIETIQNDDSPQGARHLRALAEITRLRQACCHPKLVETKIDIESSKLSAFLEITAELKENGHRALVFSQFVTHLSIVRQALDLQGFHYQYLDGATPTAKREKAIKQFQSGEGDLFLISLKAGGLGLNLTAADFVIHLDPWWNPAVEDQASDRAHRIGQSRPVTVYRLVADHTIEEKIIQLHNTKRDLADSLLEGSDQSAKLSMDELLTLIKEEANFF